MAHPEMVRMDERLVDEALAQLRMEDRLREYTDHAAKRAPAVADWVRACAVRWSESEEGDLHDCGLPAGHSGKHVLLEDQDGPLIWIGGE